MTVTIVEGRISGHSGNLSPHFSHPFYCIGEMIRRAAPTAFRDPQAGAPGLLSVPYSTLAGVSVARGATHSGQPFRRFVTNRCEKCGLARVMHTSNVS